MVMLFPTINIILSKRINLEKLSTTEFKKKSHLVHQLKYKGNTESSCV